ncbi:hypothetical protein [Streptomyces sp. NPDC018711]|uniref:hypothetical protein n=1 Tax=Streptomyces sp. NPDC018711 TaxID=3365052 RepID=UPI0037A5678C
MSRILLRGAQVITMTPHRPDAEHVDILVDGGTIAAVGDVFKAPNAEIVDFSGRVIIGQPALNGCCATPWSTIPSTICGAEPTSRPASRRNSQAPGRVRGTLRDECTDAADQVQADAVPGRRRRRQPRPGRDRRHRGGPAPEEEWTVVDKPRPDRTESPVWSPSDAPGRPLGRARRIR